MLCTHHVDKSVELQPIHPS